LAFLIFFLYSIDRLAGYDWLAANCTTTACNERACIPENANISVTGAGWAGWCSRRHFNAKGEKCTTHGEQNLFNTISLQTLAESRVEGLFVKYVLLTTGPE
jgi:hypothetical protein